MKRILLSLTALFVMAMTAVSLASCSDDDEPVAYVTVKANYAASVKDTATDAQKAAAISILGVMNSRISELEGDAFGLIGTMEGHTYVPSSAAISKVERDIMGDMTVQTCVSQLKNMTDTVSHLNFELKDAVSSDTYYSNAIF